MTLYFENPVSFLEPNAISINGIWHSKDALLAVSSYSQERGGFVTIFNDRGESFDDIEFPSHRSFQVTALAWHPEYRILGTGWENGELRIWNGFDKEFQNVGGPHKAPLTLLEFSEKGERLASCDSGGSLVGWQVDSKGQVVMVFHSDLKETITHIAFRITIKSKSEYDVEGLARAAVNGDEHALDLFSNWRPKTTARRFRVHEGSTNLSFYVGTQGGSIYYITNTGICTEVLNTEGTPLSHVIHHPQKDSLIVMMEGLTVGHFSIDSQGHLTELAKVKLNGRLQARGAASQSLTWAGNSCLAVLTGDLIVRVWDVDTNDNYVLPTNMKIYDSDDKKNSALNEIFTCIAYCQMNQTLCAGTNIGRIYFWTRITNKFIFDNPEDSWELNNVNMVSGTVKQLIWGSIQLHTPLLGVNGVTTFYIMKEEPICACFSEKIWAIQKTTTQILIESDNGNNFLLQLDEQANCIAINQSYGIFSNGRIAKLYNINWEQVDDPINANFSLKFNKSFQCESEKILIYDKSLIVLSTKNVSILTLSGSTLHSFTFNASEGDPIGVDLTGNFMTIFTIGGYLKIYDLSESTPKLVTPVKYIPDLIADFGEIIQAKCNCRGNRIAMTVAASNLIPDGKLYIWDLETDQLTFYDFKKDITDDDYEELDEIYEINSSKDNEKDEKQLFDEICANRLPLYVFWDENDPRLLICNAKRLPKFNQKFQQSQSQKIKSPQINSNFKNLQNEDHIVITMFISSECGIKIHDIRSIDPDARLFALSTPYIVIIEKLGIIREVMSDFVGLANCDKSTRSAVLDFSYNLTLGNMDAAFKAIKLVQSSGVWNSLARMCVKTQRLDVAGVCLGHMGNARAAMLLRNAMNDQTLPYEAKLAVLAVQLGMYEEAEQFYIQCGRYDLLNKLLRSRNKMEAAHNIATAHDRIHLKNTEHYWGRLLEQSGDYKEACMKYEKANTHKFDIPRMLMDQPQQLEAYMAKSKDPELLKWWGQYLESQGEMQAALKSYSLANDIYSQVRIYCYLRDESKAADVARKGNDQAAFYHLAGYYENNDDYENAVHFFTKANAYSNAVRLCRQNHMSEELWNIGQIASNREKLECARYFEEINSLDRAIILYHRAGLLHKAFDLAFKTEHYDTLQKIASNLDANSDPALVEKCAQYFVQNEHFDKAVDLLAITKKFTEAISICMEHNVELNEDLVEKLTPDKDQLEEESRIRVLEILGDSLMMQGNYHLATKKFTQAGDKVRAMKALLKSGDTEKIIFFAGVSRQRDIYIMAANYLQSLDWQNNSEILRNIITFYSKGKALDLLANFYVACAQVEIDEFKNYEKAFGALTEASKCLAKITNPKDPIQHRRATDIVQQRLDMTKRFIDIRRLFDRGDYQSGLTQCRQLMMIDSKDLEASVRRGDIYALIIQESIKHNRLDEAKQSFMELRQMLTTTSSTPITYYLTKEVIEMLAQGLGIDVAALLPNKADLERDLAENDIVEEEVVE